MRRWMTERMRKNDDHEFLQVVKVYAPHENKEVVKADNGEWTHKRELIILK